MSASPAAPTKPKRAKESVSKKAKPPVDDDDRVNIGNDDDDDDAGNDNQGGVVEKQNAQVVKEKKEKTEEERQQEMEEARSELEKLDPTSEPKRWMIGKPPEMGGTEDEYEIFVQDKLPWMARAKFFSLVARTFSQAIKASGGTVGGMEDVFGNEGGNLVERGRRLRERDFTDAGQFASLALELVGYNDKFLVECYVLWLDVPRDLRGWAKTRFNEEWAPEKGRYGLRDPQHRELIETFIDQNFEEIRSFFVEELPAIGRRVALHERSKARKALGSKSDQSKS